MTIFGIYVSTQIPNIEKTEAYGGLWTPGGISSFFSSNFPSNAVRIMSGDPFLTQVMTNFVKHVFFAKVGKVGESDPLSSDPLSSDPHSSDPLSSDLLSSDPLSSESLSSDPLSSDPLSSDIETILFTAGTKRYKSGTKAAQKGTKAVRKRYKKEQKGTKAVRKQY